ncbi:MAG TPA: hypothetical protein VFR81_11650 [Longimicrobium sp.]|nr:hypothetical protein [Longimicrobium sp.]
MLDLSEETFFDHLLDPGRRKALAAAMRAEQGSPRPLTRRYEELAYAVADADRLGRAVHALLDDTPSDDRFLHDLLMNPHTPEDALWAAYRRGRGITPLGHRRGPRALLEALAEEHEYSEAIASLALFHYAREDDGAFRRFVERHRSDYMLRWNLRRSRHVPEEKRALVADLLEEE